MIKVILNKDWLSPWGRVIKKNKRMTCDDETGRRLIKEGYARKKGSIRDRLMKPAPKVKDIAPSKDTPKKDLDKFKDDN